jgi:hypothetical protein
MITTSSSLLSGISCLCRLIIYVFVSPHFDIYSKDNGYVIDYVDVLDILM